MAIKLPSKKRCVYIVNLLIVLLYVIGALIFSLEGKPFIRGFYCDDESISKPYPKVQTVPTLQDAIAIVVVCIVCICIVEFIKIDEKKKLLNGGVRHLKPWAINVLCFLLLCVYGAGITLFVTDIGKYSIGRLRPHFLDACKPDWKKINCTGSYGIKRINNYIIGDEFCTTVGTKILKDARLSFPSGHASCTGFGAAFLILYIEDQITCEKWGSLGKLFVQVALGCGAFYIGLTRVSDYMHHPTDILAGFVLGVAVSLVLHYAVIRRFFPPITNDESEMSDEDHAQPDQNNVQQQSTILLP